MSEREVVMEITQAQLSALGRLRFPSGSATAKQLRIREDVFHRLERRGLATCNLHGQWFITDAGRKLYDFHS